MRMFRNVDPEANAVNARTAWGQAENQGEALCLMTSGLLFALCTTQEATTLPSWWRICPEAAHQLPE